jgi:hypothetical protein
MCRLTIVFWQFLESFANKQISSSEDRLEETKRRKLAIKARKLVELMMVSGIGTASGFEERIRFSEIEIVDSNAIDTGVMHTLPEGNYINGWDVNVAGVRITSVKQHIRHHRHAEFLLRIKRKGELEHFVARRYGDFAKMHRRLRLELPGRILPPLPKKNKSNSTASGLMSALSGGGNDSDASSISSTSTRMTGAPGNEGGGSLLSPLGGTHRIFFLEKILTSNQVVSRPVLLHRYVPAAPRAAPHVPQLMVVVALLFHLQQSRKPT